MSRGGNVGGPATLSSFRVQKAFSINFRENKRLRSALKNIEGEHMRAIRQVKQEITETKLWLKGVQENTGYSQHGIPNSERHHMISPAASRRMSVPASIASIERLTPRPATKGRPSQPDVMYGKSVEELKQVDSQVGSQPTHVRFTQTEQGPRRPSRVPNNQLPPPPSTAGPETGVIILGKPRPASRRESFYPKENKEIAPPLTAQPELADEQPGTEGDNDQILYGGAFEAKPRILSAASGKSNQSLTAYQRRRMLQTMVVKKQSSLDSKKEMNKKECHRVDTKVRDYLNNLSERMKITLPDISLFDFDPEKHNTPFAQNVNIST